MAKQTAEVTIDRPEKAATIKLSLGNAVRGKKAVEKLEKAAEGVNGVDSATMDGPHILSLEVAKLHTGEKKAKAVAAAVLKAIGASQKGEVQITHS